ncbi:MAG: hypothetical protein IJZ85_10075 [Lachnospiraceae bacterium]|nr:hypothetical protein [Lachnospiraceae bacterium]
MQSWEDYEADYYGGGPADGMKREEAMDDRLCPVDRWGNRMCAGDWEMRHSNPERYLSRRMGSDVSDRAGSGMRNDMRWDAGNKARSDRRNRASNGMGNDRGSMYPEMRTARDNRMMSDDRWDMEEEIREDLDEFESLFDDAAMEILRVIREMCDSMDGDGCIAMDGRMDRTLVNMLVDRVIEELDRMNGTEGRMPASEAFEANSTELSGENVNRDQDIRRSWISALLFHELLRRRMRHRRRHRNRPDFRDRWKR